MLVLLSLLLIDLVSAVKVNTEQNELAMTIKEFRFKLRIIKLFQYYNKAQQIFLDKLIRNKFEIFHHWLYSIYFLGKIL